MVINIDRVKRSWRWRVVVPTGSAMALLFACCFAMSQGWAQTPIFADVPPDHPFRTEIETFYRAGYTSGCRSNPLSYCPEQATTRAQMAVFVLGEAKGVEFAPGPDLPNPFTDTGAHPLRNWISAAADVGIVEPCAPAHYCPDLALARGVLAKWILLAKHGRTYAPPPATGVFADLPAVDPRAAWAEQLRAEGITNGCGSAPPRFCPDEPATRAQTAAFFTRAFNMPPSVEVTSVVPSGGTPGSLTTLTITATASDPDDTISSMSFSLDGVTSCPATASPATCTWTPTTSGTHSIQASATDSRGKKRTSAIYSAFVNSRPTVALTMPSAGASYTAPASISLAATASDIDGTVVKVDFLSGTSIIGTATAPPYVFAWANVAAGSYSISAQATDNASGQTKSNAVTVLVANPPTVVLTEPAASSVIAPGSSLTLNSTADSDRLRNRNVSRVVYEVRSASGAVVWSKDIPGCNPPPYGSCTAPVAYKTAWLAAGSARYTVRATVYDSAGATAVSESRAVAVDKPPTISVAFDKQSYVVPATVKLTATVGDTDGTVETVEFRANANSIGYGTRSGNTFTLSWSTSAPDSYLIRGIATDDLGGSTTSSSVAVEVLARGATVVYYHNDFAGTPLAATDQAGNVLWREIYAPYGERWTSADVTEVAPANWTDR